MRLFGRRKPERAAPTYSNSSVVERIQRDAGVDRDTARSWFNEMLVFLDLVAESDDAYRRAYDRRANYGPVDSGIWAVPAGAAVGGVAAEEAGTQGGGEAGGSGGGSSCGGGGCGGGGG